MKEFARRTFPQPSRALPESQRVPPFALTARRDSPSKEIFSLLAHLAATAPGGTRLAMTFRMANAPTKLNLTRHEAVTTLRDLEALPFRPDPRSMVGRIRSALAEALAASCARCGNPASDAVHDTGHAFKSTASGKVMP